MSNLRPDNKDIVGSFDFYDHHRNDARDPDGKKNDSRTTDTSTEAPMCCEPSVDERLANAANCDAAGKSSNNTMESHQSSFQ